MAASVLLTEEPSYIQLLDFYEQYGTKLKMQQMFKEDPGRFTKFRFVTFWFCCARVYVSRLFVAQPVYPSAVKCQPLYMCYIYYDINR